MRKRRVVGRIYGVKYRWKGHKDRNGHKNRIKKEWASSVSLCQGHKPQHPHHVKASHRDDLKKERRSLIWDRVVFDEGFHCIITDRLSVNERYHPQHLTKTHSRISEGKGVYSSMSATVLKIWVQHKAESVTVEVFTHQCPLPSLKSESNTKLNEWRCRCLPIHVRYRL